MSVLGGNKCSFFVKVGMLYFFVTHVLRFALLSIADVVIIDALQGSKYTSESCHTSKIPICGALHDLVPFVQFKKHEKHPWRSVIFSQVAGSSLQLYSKSNTPTWVFFAFFKLYKWY